MSNPYDPKTQPEEWQGWLNDRIAEHDAQVERERRDREND